MPDRRNDDRWEDDRDPGKPRKESKIPTPPMFSLLFWILIFACIPLFVLLFRNKEDKQELSQFEFDRAVAERRVDNLVIKTEGGSFVTEVTGDYTPPNSKTPRKFTAQVIYDDDLRGQLTTNGIKHKVEQSNNILGHLLLSFLPIILIIGLLYFLFSRQMRNAGKGAIQFGKSRARMVQNLEKVTFADVAGIDSAKDEVVEIVDYLRNPGKFHRLGGRVPHGVLLVGPPGTGKTLLARAIAGEADVPFFTISGSDFVEMFVGVGASRVRDMFEQAKRNSPCIIFIDEIDAVGRSRFSGMGGGHDEREQTLNALLVEMDGFEPNSGVIVIAATNRPDVLDRALLRPGRFDREVHVDLPDLVGRREILEVHMKKITAGRDLDLDSLARSTPGFSGADLANLINEAALLAARNDRDAVTTADFEEARDKVMFGKERPWRAMSEEDRKMTACHEAGHALVSLYCRHADPLHKVSIIPRGKMLGGAMYFPEGDKVSQSQTELMEHMTIAAGGRCAEKIVFGEINSGAMGDIRRCSRIARAMVTKLGMSDDLGFIEYASTDEEMGYLGHLSRPEYSEATAQKIDVEVQRLVDAALHRATEILTQNRGQLDTLTDELLEKETLSAREVYELLEMPLPDRLKAVEEKKEETPETAADGDKEPARLEPADDEPVTDPLEDPPPGLEPKPEN